MRSATRITAAALGLFAGFGGLEHGHFEALQGSVRPGSLLFPSMGAPCFPDEAWNACEPAVTVIPNLLLTGILAMVLGLVTMVWAGGFVQRRGGGWLLLLMSCGLLLVGGGVFPPFIGMIGGVMALKIQAPPRAQPRRLWRGMGALWPWALAAFFAWSFGTFAIGYFANELLMRNAILVPALILLFLLISVLAAQGYDIQQRWRSRRAAPPLELGLRRKG